VIVWILRKNWGWALGFLSLLCLTVGFPATVLYSFSFIIDKVIMGKDRWMLGYIIGALVGGAVIATVAGFFRDYIYARLCSEFLVELRQRLFNRIQSLSMDYFHRNEPGSILSRFSNDLAVIEEASSACMWYFLNPLLSMFVNLTLLFVLDWKLALLGCLVFPASFFGPKIFVRKASEASYERKKQEAEVMSRIEENVTAQTVVKSLNLQKSAIESFTRRMKDLRHGILRSFYLGALAEQSGLAGQRVLEVLVFGAGAWMVAEGQLPLGKLVAFQSLFITMNDYFATMIEFTPMALHASVGFRRVNEVLHEKPTVEDVPDAPVLPRLEKEIVFDNVVFSYVRGKKTPDLNNVSFSIKKGTSAAFVGPSGSGKSTVLSLVMRFYDPDSGEVRFDSCNIRHCSQESLRAQLGIVLQENILFNAPVRENLLFSRPGATEAEIEEAARGAEIHEFILSLPEKYDTVAGERGSRFSGGQRQRIAIARALLRGGSVMVFDEATSALDPGSEASVNATIEKIVRSDKTVLAVTHRLASVVNYDRIFVMRAGNLVESGSHSELLEKGGLYRELWEKQGGFERKENTADFTVTPERLGRVNIFAGLDRSLLEALSRVFVSERYDKDHFVIRQGELSKRFFIIPRGFAEVTVTDESDIVQEFNIFSDGDSFGESALLENSNSWTIVRTLTPCFFLSLRREDLVETLAKHPEAMRSVEEKINALTAAPPPVS
jgi:ATP-binding cassette subfamily B protein